MNNYIDIYGRYHHKPVTEANPVPSNNGWIFTAYYRKAAGIPGKDYTKLENCYYGCLNVNGKFYWRSPGKALPPMSRDEVLGVAALGLLKPEHLNGWSFSPYPLLQFSPVKLVQQLWECRPEIDLTFTNGKFGAQITPKHRNYFWQNGLSQLYRFAFSVPLSDRHFILKKWGKFRWYNPVHLFYAAFGKLNAKLSPSGLNWLKYGGEKAEKEMVKEFPVDHDIRKKLGL